MNEREGLARPTVLLAEDHDELRELVGSMLRDAGYRVDAFANGLDLAAALDHRLDVVGVPPDLIISDIRMPGCNGLQLLARLRGYDALTPVILVSAFADQQTHDEADRLGADYLLDKPFDLDELRLAALACVHP
jgi:CheY-like chemotaxis protein